MFTFTRVKHDSITMDDELVQTPCFVSIAREDMAYGGSEEGGWWYKHVEVIEKHYCANLRVLSAVMARVGSYLGISPYSYSSAASHGVYHIQVGGDILENEPRYRPHYE